ncbi:MAG: hypothetical protein U0414_41190 [Polyangiaceae bacterium]
MKAIHSHTVALVFASLVGAVLVAPGCGSPKTATGKKPAGVTGGKKSTTQKPADGTKADGACTADDEGICVCVDGGFLVDDAVYDFLCCFGQELYALSCGDTSVCSADLTCHDIDSTPSGPDGEKICNDYCAAKASKETATMCNVDTPTCESSCKAGFTSPKRDDCPAKLQTAYECLTSAFQSADCTCGADGEMTCGDVCAAEALETAGC